MEQTLLNMVVVHVKPNPYKGTSLARPSYSHQSKVITIIFGLINYLQSFIPIFLTVIHPHLSDKIAFPRTQFTNSDWNPSTDAAFQQLTAWIYNWLLHRTLAYCDREKPITIQTTASKCGLGTALLQDSCPIAFTSKTLKDTKTRYANIKTMFIHMFQAKKFHTFIYGRHITIHNDHKPLEMIQHNPIHAAPPQLERILQIQKYSFRIQYKPGKDMILADRLSRLPSGKENQPVQLHTCQLHIPVKQPFEHHTRIHRKRPYLPDHLLTHSQWLACKISSSPNSPIVLGSPGQIINWQWNLLKGPQLCIPSQATW